MTGAGQSEVGTLRRVPLVHARDAYGDPGKIERQWRRLGYSRAPLWDDACRESDRLGELLSECGAEVVWAPAGDELTLDAIYCRDSSVVCSRGLILCRMGKAERHREPAAIQRLARQLELPVAGAIEEPGSLEGGDTVWLDEQTLAVGRGYRTNADGIAQLGELLPGEVELVEVPLPHWRGPDDVFHLMSIVSPLDRDLALVHSPLLPVPFRECLLARGYRLLEVDPGELETLGCNVLALAPRVALMAAGNPVTEQRLRDAGVQVHLYPGREISLPGAGGPTCLTRPLVRA